MKTRNGPFSLEAVQGLKSYTLSGELVPCPLWLRAVGVDGAAPVDEQGNPVKLSVLWQQQDGPAAAEILDDGVSETDTFGWAAAHVRTGSAKGVYRIRATLPDFPDCADALFSVYTEDVVTDLIALPVRHSIVGTRRVVSVLARDWRGKAVPDADLVAYTRGGDLGEKALRSKRTGIYHRFGITSRRAGKLPVTIVDRKTLTQIDIAVTFLPGPVRRLSLLAVPNPRSAPPYNSTIIEVRAVDRFGNLVPHPRVSWQSSAGSFVPIEPSSVGSSAIRLSFDDQRPITVTSRCAGRSIRKRLRMPDVVLRFLEEETYTRVGGRFRLQLEVFPPVGKGLIKGLSIDLRQPATARVVSVNSAGSRSVIPEPVAHRTKGLLRLEWRDLSIPLTDSSQPLPVAQLDYECTRAGSACVSVDKAVITTSHSPDQSRRLNPGVEECRLQKWLSSKRLCLNVCIIAQNDALYELALEKVKQQVRRAQSLLDKNIGICCPDIDITACYHRFSYKEYKAHNPNGTGTHGDGLPLWKGTNPLANTTDLTKDFGPLSDVAKWLLSQCRVQQCLTIFVVPEIENVNGVHDAGYTINKNKWPESVQGAAGPTVFLYDAASDSGALTHELGHALMDTAPDHNDHVRDASRVMNRPGRTGEDFIKEECGRIFDNIGKYGGTC